MTVPRVCSMEQWLAERGLSEPWLSEPGLHRSSRNVSARAKYAALDRQMRRNGEHTRKRINAMADYCEALNAGLVRAPGRLERLAMIAQGHPDNPAVQAARRLLILAQDEQA